eukprot:5162195-Prymnesium_polylepis.1
MFVGGDGAFGKVLAPTKCLVTAITLSAKSAFQRLPSELIAARPSARRASCAPSAPCRSPGSPAGSP